MAKYTLLAAAGFAIGAAAVCLGFWLNGFDFDTRGDKAIACYMLSLGVGGFGALISVAACNIAEIK